MHRRKLAVMLGSAIVLAVLALALAGPMTQLGPMGSPEATPARPGGPEPTSGPSPVAPSQAAPSPAAPSPVVRCTAEPGPLPPVLAGDPCPDAELAVVAAVAPVGPIARMVIEPGPFYCNVVWPGVATPVVCSMFSIAPGQYMHAWVAFDGSDEIAAVMLGLNLPDNLFAPGATRPPWSATLVVVEVPPAAWVMP